MNDIQKLNDTELHNRLVRRRNSFFINNDMISDEDFLEENGTMYCETLDGLIRRRRDREAPNFNSATFERELGELQKNSLDYIRKWNTTSASSALNWIFVLKSETIRLDVLEKIRLEYPSWDFMTAVTKLTKTWRFMKENFGENRLLHDEDFYTYQKYKICPFLVDFCHITLEDVKNLREGNILFRDLVEGWVNE